MWHCCVLNERELLLSNCYTFNGEIEVFKIYFSHYCTSTCCSAINSLVAVSNLAGASVGQIRFRVVVEDLASKSDLVLLQLVDVILKLGKFRIQRLLFRSQLDLGKYLCEKRRKIFLFCGYWPSPRPGQMIWRGSSVLVS